MNHIPYRQWLCNASLWMGRQTLEDGGYLPEEYGIEGDEVPEYWVDLVESVEGR